MGKAPVDLSGNWLKRAENASRQVLGMPPEDPFPVDDDDPNLRPHPGAGGNGKGATASSGQDEHPSELVELPKIGTYFKAALDRVQRRRDRDEIPVPVLGDDYASALGGGLWVGSHALIGTTGCGKSQFAIQGDLMCVQAEPAVPIVYIGLELNQFQISLRILGEHCKIPWSHMFNGRVSDSAMARAYAAIPGLEGVPFHVDFGTPDGWVIARLPMILASMRKIYPTGPIKVTLDFLQLIAKPVGGRTADMKEHIGRCAYLSHQVAQQYDAAIALISSTARSNYMALADDIRDAGFVIDKWDPDEPPTKRILSPEKFLAMAKESGEIEYACETVTVLLKWPGKLETGETIVIAAAVKVRGGGARWAAYTFMRGRFTPYPVTDLSELPELPKRRGRGPAAAGADPVETSELEERICETVRKNKNLRTASAVQQATKGTRGKLLAVVKTMLEEGRLEMGVTGFRVVETAEVLP